MSWAIAIWSLCVCIWVTAMTGMARVLFGIITTHQVMLPAFMSWVVAALCVINHTLRDD